MPSTVRNSQIQNTWKGRRNNHPETRRKLDPELTSTGTARNKGPSRNEVEKVRFSPKSPGYPGGPCGRLSPDLDPNNVQFGTSCLLDTTCCQMPNDLRLLTGQHCRSSKRNKSTSSITQPSLRRSRNSSVAHTDVCAAQTTFTNMEKTQLCQCVLIHLQSVIRKTCPTLSQIRARALPG